MLAVDLSSSAFLMLASPVSAMWSSGLAFCAACTAASEWTTDFSVTSVLPGRLNVTSAEWPSFEI